MADSMTAEWWVNLTRENIPQAKAKYEAFKATSKVSLLVDVQKELELDEPEHIQINVNNKPGYCRDIIGCC